jgi:hypothetical protein
MVSIRGEGHEGDARALGVQAMPLGDDGGRTVGLGHLGRRSDVDSGEGACAGEQSGDIEIPSPLGVGMQLSRDTCGPRPPCGEAILMHSLVSGASSGMSGWETR